MASFAGFFDHTTGTLTTRASLSDAENAPGTDHLTTTTAGGASLTLGTRFRAGTVTNIATILLRDGNFLFTAVRRFLKGDLHIVAEISAALRLRGVRTRTAKQIKNAAAPRTTKDSPENVGGIVEATTAATAAP